MLATLTIPTGAKCLLKAGQNVTFDSPYLEKKVSTVVTILAAKKLGVTPNKIFNHLQKFVGDNVVTGDLLAINKGMLSTKKIYSEYTGIIKEVDHHTGNIIVIATSDSEEKQKAFFKGEVAEVKKNEIVVELKKGKAFMLQKATGDFGGRVSYSTDELTSKILVADTLTPYQQLKAEAIGTCGFILLTKLNETTNLPIAQVKNIDDFKKIKELHFPYCLISASHSTIYFYE